jgi:hypothetical protein
MSWWTGRCGRRRGGHGRVLRAEPLVLDGRQWAFPTSAPLAMVEVLELAVDLQGAAERIIRACAQPGETPAWVAREGGRVAREYYLLHARLGALDTHEVPYPVQRRGAELLSYHMRLLDACLNLAFPKYRSPKLESRRMQLGGLGPPAEELRILRDELYRQLW